MNFAGGGGGEGEVGDVSGVGGNGYIRQARQPSSQSLATYGAEKPEREKVAFRKGKRGHKVGVFFFLIIWPSLRLI